MLIKKSDIILIKINSFNFLIVKWCNNVISNHKLTNLSSIKIIYFELTPKK